MRAPVYVDIGLWAAMIWSAQQWGQQRYGRALALLAVAVMWHEAALVLALAFVFDCLLQNRPERNRAVVKIIAISAVAFLVPRIVFRSSASYDWSDYLANAWQSRVAAIGRPSWFAWLLATVGYGAGSLIVLAAPGLRQFRSSSYGFLLAIVPGTVVLLALFDNRNLPPAAALIGVLSLSLWLNDKPKRILLAASAGFVLSWTVFATAYLSESRVAVASTLAIATGAAVMALAQSRISIET